MFTTVRQLRLYSPRRTDAILGHIQSWESYWVPNQKEPALLTHPPSTHQVTTEILFGDNEFNRLPPQQSLSTWYLLEALTQLQVPRDRPQTQRNITKPPDSAKPPKTQQRDAGRHLGGFCSDPVLSFGCLSAWKLLMLWSLF